MTAHKLGIWIAVIGGLTLGVLFCFDPINQPLCYHNFADQKTILGIPHFWNVVSNLPFLVVGLLAARILNRYPQIPRRTHWVVFAAGVFLVGIGSSYYHLDPKNATLVWDRMPMTLGFMAAFCAIGAEALGPKMERLLWPLVGVGVASVCVWWAVDDLRFYAWVQFFPLLALVMMLVFAGDRIAGSKHVIWALGYYLAAKVFENWDQEIQDLLFGIMSGHPIKHVLAGLGTWELVVRIPQLSGRAQI